MGQRFLSFLTLRQKKLPVWTSTNVLQKLFQKIINIKKKVEEDKRLMRLTFIPLQENHFPLLLKWLETPHVKAWWDQDVQWIPELIKNRFETYVLGYKILKNINKPMHSFIICRNGKEIGYIQYYNAYDFPREQGYVIEGLPKTWLLLMFLLGRRMR